MTNGNGKDRQRLLMYAVFAAFILLRQMWGCINPWDIGTRIAFTHNRFVFTAPVDVVHDVLIHVRFRLRRGLVLRVRAWVNNAVHVDVEVIELIYKGRKSNRGIDQIKPNCQIAG